MNKQAEMAVTAYKALSEKKGEDITIIEISQISIMADYFVISNGANLPQVQAMVENVQEKMGKSGFEVKRVEGNRSSSWILLDYGDVVVHIFDKEDRLFYDLERIWSDGKTVTPEELQQ
ncbi:MAG: ribosome silencing factor [Lachnospiraceae bacterium]|jgi:iojap-like ribosome-associated protein|nr:ribosome silencing factor [Lachnospiraceae bacterium]MCI8780620.1 ribosome silencing factor [Lachnospiraceae bacterium]RKI42256.1 ribosome silencing factor [bacterium D16-59]RKI61000.1 ribosome silencing factor [bacterium D16-51]